jgi:toxin ParE1/3/4
VPNGTHKVVFSPEAKADLLELYGYIAEASSEFRALGYIERVEHKCLNLSTFPTRGVPRDDIRQGLRVIGFERSANIAFAVVENAVIILRVLYRGRDIGTDMSRE